MDADEDEQWEWEHLSFLEALDMSNPTVDCDECKKIIEVDSFPNAVLCCGCIFCCEECFKKHFEEEPLPKHQCDMCGSYHYGRYSIAFCSEDCMTQSKKLDHEAKRK